MRLWARVRQHLITLSQGGLLITDLTPKGGNFISLFGKKLLPSVHAVSTDNLI